MKAAVLAIVIASCAQSAFAADPKQGQETFREQCGLCHLGGPGDGEGGQAPSLKEMQAGFAPQLTLTAAILKAGGFREVGPADPQALTYVRVTGRRIPGEEHVRAEGDEAATMAAEALEGLARRLARFEDVTTPYVSWAAPKFMGEYGGDYDHLARVREWAVLGGGEEGGE